MIMNTYDTWEQTDSALSVIHKTVHMMCDLKPKSGTAEEKAWENEMKELRKWAILVHERRIAINVKRLKEIK